MSDDAVPTKLVRGRWAFAPLSGVGQTHRWAVLRDGERCGHRRWIEALRDDADARMTLTETLRVAPFRAYLWETPPLLPDNDAVTAEMALVGNDTLARRPSDSSAFSAAVGASDRPVATFANLGGDAVLVAPHPVHAPEAAHLASFVRTAPETAIDALWIAVGAAVAQWLTTQRRAVWVSTSGLAVPWLHVRLDRTPKYYSYRPYTIAPR